MVKYRREFRRVHKSIWGAVALLLVFSFLLQNVAGSAYYSLLVQPATTVTSPPVELQEGTAGNSTIYANGTSAKVGVSGWPSTYFPNNANVVNGTYMSGTMTSLQSVDSDWYNVSSESTATSATAYNPDGYSLLGSTSNVSGSISNLTSDDGAYMTFRSYFDGTNGTDPPIATLFDDLILVVLYENGTYVEDVEWGDIAWGQVDKVGVKRADLGRAGFETTYGSVLWYPKRYTDPVMFVFQRFWAKVGGTWYDKYITKNVTKTRFLVNETVVENGVTGEEWVLGWNGTIEYSGKDFPVTIAMKASQFGEEWALKTNVTTPIDLDNHGIEYRFYVNPDLVGNVEKNVKYVRFFYSNGTTEDYNIKQFANLTTKIPNLVYTLAFLNEEGKRINFFDFEDVFSIGTGKFISIEEVTLPDNSTTYCLRLGAKFGPLNANETMVIDPSTVGTSSSSLATRYNFQRKVFYANGRFWAFYSDGSDMVFRTSTTGAEGEWSNATVVREASDGDMFSVWYERRNSTDYLHYSSNHYQKNKPLKYRRGVLNANGTITWSAAEQDAVPATANVLYKYSFICVDSGGYPWIAYLQDAATDTPYVTKSSTNDGTWSTATGFPYELTNTTGTYQAMVIPLSGSKVYAMYGMSNYITRGKLYNGTAWSGEENCTQNNVSEFYGSSAAADENDNIHYVYLTYSGNNVTYGNRTTSWQSEVIVQASQNSTSYPSINIHQDTGDLRVFWFYNNTVYMKKRTTAGGWGSLEQPSGGARTSPQTDTLTCYYQANGGKIGWIWTEGSSPYTVMHGHISIYYKMEVEFYGSSNVEDWTQLEWTIDSGWTIDTVSVTLQLYNYTLGGYPTSGDAYMSYNSSGTADTDETKNKTITLNLADFRNGTGYWKVKIKGVRSASTPFDFKADWIEFKPTYNEYTVSTEFTFSSMTTDPPSQLNFTIVSQYNIASVNVTIQVYNYTGSSYATSGEAYLNYTSSSTPSTDETKPLNITTNPQDYASSGNAKIKITGAKTTPTQFQQKTNQLKLDYQAISDFNYVLNMTEKDSSDWEVRLKAYADSNKDRLENCSIYIYNGSNSTQIIILNGVYDQQTGPWIDLNASDTEYIWIHVETSGVETSRVYAYLEIRVPNTTTYAQYILTFKIT